MVLLYYCRRTGGPTRRSSKGGWTPEEVRVVFPSSQLILSRECGWCLQDPKNECIKVLLNNRTVCFCCCCDWLVHWVACLICGWDGLDQDEVLRRAVQWHKGKNWKKIGESFYFQPHSGWPLLLCPLGSLSLSRYSMGAIGCTVGDSWEFIFFSLWL